MHVCGADPVLSLIGHQLAGALMQSLAVVIVRDLCRLFPLDSVTGVRALFDLLLVAYV